MFELTIVAQLHDDDSVLCPLAKEIFLSSAAHAVAVERACYGIGYSLRLRTGDAPGCIGQNKDDRQQEQGNGHQNLLRRGQGDAVHCFSPRNIVMNYLDLYFDVHINSNILRFCVLYHNFITNSIQTERYLLLKLVFSVVFFQKAMYNVFIKLVLSRKSRV